MKKENKNNIFQIDDQKTKIDFYLKDITGLKISFDNYKFIKYIGRKEIENLSDFFDPSISYHHFEIDLCSLENLKQNFIDFLKPVFDDINTEQDFENKIEEINNFFKKQNKQLSEEKLLGDLGEALFILKCCQLGLIQEVLLSHSKTYEGTYDFYPKNKTPIEVKTITSSTKEFWISSNQIKDAHIVTVQITKVENHKNINWIYSEIKKKIDFNLIPDLLEQKIEKYKNCDESLINQFCIIDFNDVLFNFYDKTDLPQIKEYTGKFKDVKFLISENTNSNANIEFQQRIKDCF